MVEKGLIVQDQPLENILASLKEAQRSFLIYRLMGITAEQAVSLVNRQKGTLEQFWRKDEFFSAVEDCLMENKDAYIGEANAYFHILLKGKMYCFLTNMLDRGMKWDRLDKDDKRYVMQAVDIITKMKEDRGVVASESWEHKLFKGGK